MGVEMLRPYKKGEFMIRWDDGRTKWLADVEMLGPEEKDISAKISTGRFLRSVGWEMIKEGLRIMRGAAGISWIKKEKKEETE